MSCNKTLYKAKINTAVFIDEMQELIIKITNTINAMEKCDGDSVNYAIDDDNNDFDNEVITEVISNKIWNHMYDLQDELSNVSFDDKDIYEYIDFDIVEVDDNERLPLIRTPYGLNDTRQIYLSGYEDAKGNGLLE